jgi:hypothetical protein
MKFSTAEMLPQFSTQQPWLLAVGEGQDLPVALEGHWRY